MTTPTQPVLYPSVYTRGVPPTDPAQVIAYLSRELQKLEQTIRRLDRRLTTGAL